MIAFLADENFSGAIITGLVRCQNDIDIEIAQKTELAGAADPEVLEWAARHGRVLLTHDRRTMIGHAYDRVRRGLPMPGVIELQRTMPIGQAIEEILLIAICSDEAELEGRVIHLPM